jgi:hypothetical protein
MGKFRNCLKKGAILSLSGLTLGLLISGCGGGSSPLPSGSFTTNTIYAYMTAVQDERGDVTTIVQLRNGPASTDRYLYLSSGETLYSTLNIPPQQYLNFNNNLFGNTLTLSQHLKSMASRDLYFNYGLFDQVAYGKPEYFATDTPANGVSPVRAYVDFERSGNTFTGESSIDLPAGFNIVSPASATTLSRAQPLTLSWDNVDATATMSLDVAGVCSDGNRYTMTKDLGTDTGTISLSGSDYFPAAGISASANCLTAFVVRRSGIPGPASSKFATGSSFTGVQQRTVQFTTTP